MLTIEIGNLSDIFSLNDVIGGGEFIFRGLPDSKYGIESTFNRNYEFHEEHLIKHQVELRAIKHFQTRASDYLSKVPDDEALVDWLVYLQHYGGYTRLIDFTKSIYIALFFAFEKKFTHNNQVIWGINPFLIEMENKTNIFRQNKLKETIKSYMDLTGDQTPLLNDILSGTLSVEDEDNFLLYIDPQKKVDRIWMQKGVFMTIANLQSSFNEVISKYISSDFQSIVNDHNTMNIKRISEIDLSDLHKEKMIKIVFSKHIQRRKIIRELVDMNITAESLFPGLEGYARASNYVFDLYSLKAFSKPYD